MEIVSEGFHNLQVAIHRSLRVITTLEFLQHHLAKLGHRDLLVTHTLLQRCRNLQAAARDSVRRAGGFVQTPFSPAMFLMPPPGEETEGLFKLGQVNSRYISP